MAIDTRDRRFSMVGLGSPTPRIFPNPDGTIGVFDRAMHLYLYHGLDLTTGSPVWRRWGDIPHMRIGPRQLGRSWG